MTDCAEISGPLNATGDIVGYGILAAFLGSAVVTIVAVLLAYYHDAIEDDLISDVDRKFRDELQCMMKFINRRFNFLFSGLINILNRVFRRTTDHSNTRGGTQNSIELREMRIACFNQFLLSLSDQQLVTGLALLFITTSRKTTLSGHEFSVAHSLAWFSSTTHLATLDVLRPALRSQGRFILALRVLAIFYVFMLLTYTSSWASWQLSRSKLPVPCSAVQSAGFENVQTGLVLIIIWCGYISRFFDIYLNDGFDFFVWAFINSFLSVKHSEPTALTPSQRRAKLLANRKYNALLRIKKLQEHNPLDSAIISLCKHAYQLELSTFQYNRAFLSTIPMISFSFSYGICQVVSFAFIEAPDLTNEARELGFGQLMALLLLLLPFLAAGEVFGDYRSKKRAPRSTNANLAVVEMTEFLRHEPEQPTRHAYDINFEKIKEYLFTTVEDPSEIPEDRRDLLYQEYQGLLTAERSGLGKLPIEMIVWPFVLLHVIFGVMLAIGLVIHTDGLLYLYGLIFFLMWLVFQILDFFEVILVSWERTSPAQRLYAETEYLVQGTQREVPPSAIPSNSV